MKLVDHYRRERDDAEGTDGRKRVYRAYALASLFMASMRALQTDGVNWRRSALDAFLPVAFMPFWYARSDEDLLELWRVLERARATDG